MRFVLVASALLCACAGPASWRPNELASVPVLSFEPTTAALPAEDRRAMVAAELMGTVYWRLLRKLEFNRYNVFGPQPVRLSKPHKLALVIRSWLRFALGATTPNYGTA